MCVHSHCARSECGAARLPRKKADSPKMEELNQEAGETSLKDTTAAPESVPQASPVCEN
jgi:hypothetical protein